jgi:competence ComEA-like helix-hairpin-helix protein
MSVRSTLESALGLTRGDVTVALFVAATALFGFVYLTFFDDRLPERDRLELLRLQARYDSITAARERAPLAAFERDRSADTLPSLDAVLAENAALPEERPATKEKPGAAKASPGSPIDLNTASKQALMDLPGIGEKTAEAIIERRRHVPFRRPEDLMEIKGIGEKKLAKIRPFVRIR